MKKQLLSCSIKVLLLNIRKKTDVFSLKKVKQKHIQGSTCADAQQNVAFPSMQDDNDGNRKQFREAIGQRKKGYVAQTVYDEQPHHGRGQ